MTNKRSGITPDIVVAIAAVLVALSALAVSVHQGMETRRHNRLSVLPAFDFSREEHKEAELIGVFLENNGLGPGIICKLNALVDGTSFPIQSAEEWRAVLEKLDINEPWAVWRFLGVGSTVKQKERFFLLAAKNKQLDIDRKNRFLRALDRLQFQVEYKSMYGEQITNKTSFSKRR